MMAHDETPGETLEEPGHTISASVKKKRYSTGDERWQITLYGPRTLIDEIHTETYEGREWSGGGEYRSGDPENCYYHLGLGPTDLGGRLTSDWTVCATDLGG